MFSTISSGSIQHNTRPARAMQRKVKAGALEKPRPNLEPVGSPWKKPPTMDRSAEGIKNPLLVCGTKRTNRARIIPPLAQRCNGSRGGPTISLALGLGPPINTIQAMGSPDASHASSSGASASGRVGQVGQRAKLSFRNKARFWGVWRPKLLILLGNPSPARSRDRDRQAIRSGEGLRRPAQALGGRTHHRLAQPLPPTGQGLGEPQPQRARLHQARVHSTHAPKTL